VGSIYWEIAAGVGGVHSLCESIGQSDIRALDFNAGSQATVLLAANVSFLAIPSVDNGPDVRSPSQIASYLSVLTSVASIITGLLLIGQYRNKKDSAEDVVSSFFNVDANICSSYILL
jgi:hypothetical protein